MGNLMQGAAEIIEGKDDAVHGLLCIGGQIDGFRPTANQPGIVRGGKTLLEQANQILTIVGHRAARQISVN